MTVFNISMVLLSVIIVVAVVGLEHLKLIIKIAIFMALIVFFGYSLLSIALIVPLEIYALIIILLLLFGKR